MAGTDGCRRLARLGAWPGRAHLRRHVGPRVPRGNEGRAAAARLAGAPARAGLRFHMRHRWLGWPEDAAGGAADLRFDTPEGERRASADAVVLALGGGSWARLGSDGAWAPACARVALPWRRCGRPIAGSTWTGRNISASATRASRSSRCPCAAAMTRRRGRASSWSRAAASRAAWSMRCRRRCAIACRPMVARPRAGSAARLAAGKSDGGGDASARLAFAVQPFAEPAGPDRREGGLAARMRG